MISLDLMKSSEVRKAVDRSKITNNAFTCTYFVTHLDEKR